MCVLFSHIVMGNLILTMSLVCNGINTVICFYIQDWMLTSPGKARYSVQIQHCTDLPPFILASLCVLLPSIQ